MEKVKVEVEVEVEENAVDAMEKDQGEPLNLILETSPIASHCLSPVKISLSLIWKVSSALFLVEDICSYSLLTLFFTLFLFFIFIDFFFFLFLLVSRRRDLMSTRSCSPRLGPSWAFLRPL